MTLTLSTLVDAVPPDRIDEHRATVEDIWQRALWEIALPIGHAHPVKRKDFGSLPLAPRKPTSNITRVAQDTGTKLMPVLPANIQMANDGDRIGQNQPSNQPVKRRRKKLSRHGKNKKKQWLTIAILFCILLTLIIIKRMQ